MQASMQAVAVPREPGWIYSRAWDLKFIIFSAVLVPFPFLLAWSAEHLGGVSTLRAIDLVNVVVAALIGGFHLFSTFTLTFLNRPFLRRHPYYAAGSAILPVIVVYLGVYHYTLLINVFFAWASLHVLHQVIYLSDCYRTRLGRPDPLWSRAIDYAVILTGLYPIGLYKLSIGQFHVGGVRLPYPEWLQPLHLPEIVGAVFGVLVLAWLFKTAKEQREGRLSVPKTLLIGITSLVSFFLPLGSNLDVLFQGYNTWHSFQYLFLLWVINRLRYARGKIESGFVQRIARNSNPSVYYGAMLAATAALVLITFAVRAVSHLSPDQSYFIVVLSVLLIHYYFDHFLFTRTDLIAG